MTLRRAGTVPSAAVRYGPGSAAHRKSAALRPGHAKPLILPEYDRGHPARHQRHECGYQAIDKTVLVRRGGDELLEADLDDFERGIGSCHQRAIGKQFYVDIVGPDRDFSRKWNAGAKQRRRQKSHRGRGLAIQAVLVA